MAELFTHQVQVLLPFLASFSAAKADPVGRGDHIVDVFIEIFLINTGSFLAVVTDLNQYIIISLRVAGRGINRRLGVRRLF